MISQQQTQEAYDVAIPHRHSPYLPSTNFETVVRQTIIQDHLTSQCQCTNGEHFIVKSVSRCPRAAIPMHPNRQIGGCIRLFIGGASYSMAEGVVQALVEIANEEDQDNLHDPICVVHVNTCKPHFLVRCTSQDSFEQVCGVMGEMHWEHVADSRNMSIQVMFQNYGFAIKTPKEVDALLRAKIPEGSPLKRAWDVTKPTGGLQLVMLPRHAQRLLALSGRCAQDTDGNLVVAQYQWVADRMNTFLKNSNHDLARQMCTPMRFVSIEERRQQQSRN